MVLPQPDWIAAPRPKLIVSIHSFVFLLGIECSSIVNDGWRAPVARFARCAGGTGSQREFLSNRGPVPHPPWKGHGRNRRALIGAPLPYVPEGPALRLSPIVPAGWHRLSVQRFGGRIRLRPFAPAWRGRRPDRASCRRDGD